MSRITILVRLIFLNKHIITMILVIKNTIRVVKYVIEVELIKLEKSNLSIDLKSLVRPQVLQEIL